MGYNYTIRTVERSRALLELLLSYLEVKQEYKEQLSSTEEVQNRKNFISQALKVAERFGDEVFDGRYKNLRQQLEVRTNMNTCTISVVERARKRVAIPVTGLRFGEIYEEIVKAIGDLSDGEEKWIIMEGLVGEEQIEKELEPTRLSVVRRESLPPGSLPGEERGITKVLVRKDPDKEVVDESGFLEDLRNAGISPSDHHGAAQAGVPSKDEYYQSRSLQNWPSPSEEEEDDTTE